MSGSLFGGSTVYFPCQLCGWGVSLHRLVTLLPTTWAFIAVCSVLRLVEGIGTAMFNIALFSTLPKFFPKSVTRLVVSWSKFLCKFSLIDIV